MIFEGSAVALATPFTEDGINLDTLEQLVLFQMRHGTDAILVNGTTGEPATTTDEEKEQVVRTTVRVVDGQVPVIVGVGGNNTKACADAARKARDLGAQAVLAVSPYYNKCETAGLIQHFETIADAAEIPVIVYNIPSRTNVNITPQVFLRLAQHPDIVAIKEASGNISQITETIRLAGDQASVYSGNDDHVVPVLSVGGCGVISVAANIMPAYMHEMVHAYRSGNPDKARQMQLEVNGLVRALFSEVNPIPVKTALRLMGFDMGYVRLPLTRLSPDKERHLIEQMNIFGLVDEEIEL